MSLTTNTIAYEGPRARGISVRGIGFLVAGLVLGSVIGLAIATSSTTTDAPEMSVTGMALDDFIRLNTTSFDGLGPVAASVTDPRFLEMNIGSLEYAAGGYTEPSSGIR